jgi:hypothetical protein
MNVFVFIPLSPSRTHDTHKATHIAQVQRSGCLSSGTPTKGSIDTVYSESQVFQIVTGNHRHTTHSTKVHVTTSLTSYKQARLTHSQQAHDTAGTKAWTHSSPILRTSNRPQPVPMSLSWISSGRFTIVAPATEGSPPRGYKRHAM